MLKKYRRCQYPGAIAFDVGRLQPEKLIGARVDLDEGTRLLTMMDRFPGTGVTIIDRFGVE
ncbi:alcohol dehydrogenase [uncultured Tistrella sp.]|uniref:alcohol dehydrogenase n=1 Tax=Tistrella mobilis TaxID=171437 RepID=UPI002623F157|nr:alcohol dehydrogenase [uncultured Tistrella sp.]